MERESVGTILLRLPNWLGDAVMASACVEALKRHYPRAGFLLVGSAAACGIYARDERIKQVYIDSTKSAKCRTLATLRLAKSIRAAHKIDIAITFTNHFHSALLLRFVNAAITIGFSRIFGRLLLDFCLKKQKAAHQVLTYAKLLDPLEVAIEPRSAIIRGGKNIKSESLISTRKVNIGINPGAAYGSAKRWHMEGFVALSCALLAQNCNLYIFGAGAEAVANSELFSAIAHPNLHDLSNKTSMAQLVDSIADLDLFITNDSGPMHIADALGVRLVAIFGPTDDADTSPFNATLGAILRGEIKQKNGEIVEKNGEIIEKNGENPRLDSAKNSALDSAKNSAIYKWKNARIINLRLKCAPCKRRVCPLKHHNCMRQITPEMVLEAANELIQTALDSKTAP